MKIFVTVTIAMLGLVLSLSVVMDNVKVRYTVSAEHQIEEVK